MDVLRVIDLWDKAVVQWFQAELQFPVLRTFMEFITSPSTWIIPMAVLWLWMLSRGGARGRVAALLLLPLLLLSDYVTAKVFKVVIGRPRPLGHGGFAMPSVHATNSFAIATLFSFFIDHLAFRITAFSLAVLVAISRVYVGVHYPSDIIVGALLGTADALIIIGLYYASRSWLERNVPLLFPVIETEEQAPAEYNETQVRVEK